MLNRPPIEEYIEGTGKIRDLINDPLHPSLQKDKSKHAMLASCLDTIGDTDRCLEAFMTADIDKLDKNDQYVYIYGTLQAFVVQQDSVRHLLDSLNISYQLDQSSLSSLDQSSLSSLMEIRDIRNRATGHPTSTETDTGNVFNFIPRNQITSEGFQLNAYYLDEGKLKFKHEHVNMLDLIATQRQILENVLDEVIKILKKQ